MMHPFMNHDLDRKARLKDYRNIVVLPADVEKRKTSGSSRDLQGGTTLMQVSGTDKVPAPTNGDHHSLF